MKNLKLNLLLLSMFCSNSLFANQNNTIEELIIKDEKIVMIRDSSTKRDYFFHMDKISYIEKDTKSMPPKYVISLNNGKNITIYKKDNYRKLITIFLDMKKAPENDRGKTVNDKKEIKKDSYPYSEKNEIDNMNISNSEKIIALDPLDIKEYRP